MTEGVELPLYGLSLSYIAARTTVRLAIGKICGHKLFNFTLIMALMEL